ncbi:MAG TPA: PDZ domain-containing protein [Haliangiales bacterium]|nr:PDZ domain-containing protein [Haliangiales bacterium]
MKLWIPALAAALVSGVGATASAKEGPGVLKERFSLGAGSRLGIQVQSMPAQLRAYFGAPGGVLVASVEEGSPAEKAGLKAGDVVIEVDGARTDEPGDVIRAVSKKQEGEATTLAVIRDKRRMSVTAYVRGPAGGAGMGAFDRLPHDLAPDNLGFRGFSPEGWQKLEERLQAIEKRLEQLEKAPPRR